jgi:hypothetical protein
MIWKGMSRIRKKYPFSNEILIRTKNTNDIITAAAS